MLYAGQHIRLRHWPVLALRHTGLLLGHLVSWLVVCHYSPLGRDDACGLRDGDLLV